MELDIKKMTAQEIGTLKYRTNVRFINAIMVLRAAGRGDERHSEIMAKSDPLSLEYAQAEKARQAVIDECHRRLDDHGNLRAIKETA
jgi:hypothetical protein